MKYNYKGFPEYFDEALIKLKKSLEDTYQKITGSKFDTHQNKFLNAVREKKANQKEIELDLSDKEFATAAAICFLNDAEIHNDMILKFQNYEFAFAIKGFVNNKVVLEEFNKTIKKDAAIQRWLNDPKTIEKALVKECWIAWQKDKSRYKTQISFAEDMLDKFTNLTSTKVIEKWCSEWKKEVTLLA